ncbi:Uncharacterised protein [Mycoplasmoides gallisepticum]|uniref:Uncharacterized protein n=1 Tax=Mycoplasmoides gallisepticum TaxID=2096 RepID=A0A3B0PWJ2_MYCGL|nr:Uncharacterised protein [Mycoplasmoides gallisepticum]
MYFLSSRFSSLAKFSILYLVDFEIALINGSIHFKHSKVLASSSVNLL